MPSAASARPRSTIVIVQQCADFADKPGFHASRRSGRLTRTERPSRIAGFLDQAALHRTVVSR